MYLRMAGPAAAHTRKKAPNQNHVLENGKNIIVMKKQVFGSLIPTSSRYMNLN